MNIIRFSSGLLALSIGFAPLQAKNGADDLYGEIEHGTYDDSEKMTTEQKAAAKIAKKAAKDSAKLAEKNAKAAAKAAKSAAKGQSSAQRAAVAAQGEFLIEQAKFNYELSSYEALLSLASSNLVSVESIPDPEDIVEDMRERAVADKAFYESMVTKTPAERVTALAARNAELLADAAELAAFTAGLNELQVAIFKAAFEVADEVIDVAEAKAEADDKQFLATLTTEQYIAELASRKAAKIAAASELAALDTASRAWASRAREATRDIDEIDDAIAYLDGLPD